MKETRDECVGCPPEIGCMGRSCPYTNVEVTICDRCHEDAMYSIDDEDFCEDCAQKYLTELFQSLSLQEQAELVDVELEELE